MKKPLRSNQRDGYVFEAYAEASSKVENIRRLTKDIVDPTKNVRLEELYRKARNEREQARNRLDPFEELCDELTIPPLPTPERREQIIKDRDRLVGEIMIRLYHVDLASTASKRVIGA
jgi:hypothetical protein